MRRFHLAGALFVAAAVVAPHDSYAQASKIIMSDPFPPTAGWSMETDDAFTLMRAGCIEGLARIDFEQNLQPSLATSWKQISPRFWDFSIRQGVTFHDGQELNAAAVVKSLNHVLSAAAPARAFNSKVASSVKAIGNHAVRITTPNPSVLLPYRLASANAGILSPTAYKDAGSVNPIETCTGPFVLKSVVPKQLLKLVRNESYWGGPVGVAEAEVHFIIDGNARVTQLKSGEAQIATKIPLASKGGLEKIPGITVHAMAIPRTMAVYLNNNRAPFNNPLIRKAVQAAMDTNAIVASAYEGIGLPAIGPFAPSEPWAPAIKPIVQDADRAKTLLAEAGIKPGELKIDLRAYNSRPELPDVAQIIQQQLKAVGIDVVIKITNWAGMAPSFKDGTYDMAMMSRGHQLDVADPLGFLQADYTCEGSFNMSHVCNPEIDALLKNAAGVADNDKRFDVYRKVARWLQEEAINVFVVHQEETNAVRSNVKNFRTHPLNHYYLTKDLAIVPM